MDPPTFIITDKAGEKNCGQMCGILLVNLPQTKAKKLTRTVCCGIQIKVIHNYKAETNKSSTNLNKINTMTNVFVKFKKLSGDKDPVRLPSIYI